MPNNSEISEHYARGDLLDSIRRGVDALGRTMDSVTVDDLAAVDEFHIGGQRASQNFLSQLNIGAPDHVVDIGCGLGGTSRFVAQRYGCAVSGIDLTAEFVETGTELCRWVGLEDRISLCHGSALSTPFGANEFDGGYMLHVGMNIKDKTALFTEVSRILKPGGCFGVYDVMATGNGDLAYPVPWADTFQTDAVAAVERYTRALHDAGFHVTALRNRREFALTFFEQLRSKTTRADLPPLGTHILMGDSAKKKVQNMLRNISSGCVAPVELICRNIQAW